MDKLLAIIGLAQRVGCRDTLTRLFSHIVIIIGLFMTTALMISATLIGSLINMHIALLNNDVPPALAFIYIGSAALLIIAALFAVIAWRIRCLKKIPRSIFGESPLVSRAIDALTAFSDGLMAD